MKLIWDKFVEDADEDEVVFCYESGYCIESQGNTILDIRLTVLEVSCEDSSYITASYTLDCDYGDSTPLGDKFDSVESAMQFCEDWLHTTLLDVKSAVADIV